MSVTVRYFASLREALGPQETLEFPAASGAMSVADLRDRLIAQGEPHASVLARGRAVRCALDQVLCKETALVQDGAEIAFFPPVTGG